MCSGIDVLVLHSVESHVFKKRHRLLREDIGLHTNAVFILFHVIYMRVAVSDIKPGSFLNGHRASVVL